LLIPLEITAGDKERLTGSFFSIQQTALTQDPTDLPRDGGRRIDHVHPRRQLANCFDDKGIVRAA
jgi:hypothetical protein